MACKSNKKLNSSSVILKSLTCVEFICYNAADTTGWLK